LLVVMYMPRGLVYYLRAMLRGRVPGPATSTPADRSFVSEAALGRGGAAALGMRGVTVRFGGLAAVDGLSLDLGRGEILALIGPNGAGKYTAFNVITGFQPADAGRVEFDGADITGLPPYRIAERGLVRMFQRPSVFPERPRTPTPRRAPPRPPPPPLRAPPGGAGGRAQCRGDGAAHAPHRGDSRTRAV